MRVVLIALISVATWTVFFGAIGGEFLAWDDDINITANPHIRGLDGEHAAWMFSNSSYVRRYIPMGWVGWAVQYRLFGQNAAAYHLENVLLHTLSAIVILLILRRLLLSAMPSSERHQKESAAWIAAGIAAILWAIHPLRVEPVAWASGLLYCQAVLLILISCYAYLRYCASREEQKPRSFWFWISVSTYGLSLLTYPLGLGFAAVLVVLDVFPLRRFEMSAAGLRSTNARDALVEKVPFGIAAGLVLAATLWARSHAGGLWSPPPSLAEFGVIERAMRAFYVWACYLWRTLVPTNLTPSYIDLVEFNPLEGPFVASLLAIVAVSGLVFWKRSSLPGLVAVWASYLILLVPMLGLTDHPHYSADRYSYLPSVALAAVIAGAVVRLWPYPIWRGAAIAAAVGIGIACGVSSAKQVKVWHDTDTLFSHIIAKMGDSPMRADFYSRLGSRRLQQTRFADAEKYFAEAVRIAPNLAEAHRGRAEALIRQGRREEALALLTEALKQQPNVAELQVCMADLLTDLGRYREALRYYRAVVDTSPGNYSAMNGLAWLLATCPDEQVRDGVQAVAFAEKVTTATRHQEAKAEATLAAAYAEMGALDKAVKTAERAMVLAHSSGNENQISRCTKVLERIQRLK